MNLEIYVNVTEKFFTHSGNKRSFPTDLFFHKCLLNSVGVGLGFIEPRAVIIAKGQLISE